MSVLFLVGDMKNRILLLEWHSFGTPFIVQGFQELGYEIEKLPIPRENIDTRNDANYAEKLVYQIVGKEYAAVFTFNYFPVVAIACKACKVPYVSWTYDSPFIQLYSKTLAFETNFVFVFDSNTVRELHAMGYNNVQYLPMAAAQDYYANLLKQGYNKKKYQSDVAFVGSLYNEDFHNPFRKMKEISGYYKGMIDGLLQAQKNIYGYNFLQEILAERQDLVEKIYELCPVTVLGDGLETIEWVYANYYLSRQVTALDRCELLEKMAKQFQTCIYSPEKSNIPDARNKSKVDYYMEAPFVYNNSKVNLNITLRSIQTGIPLRAFDIMGCGGLLLSNYQEDFLEYFEPDIDFVMYGSHEEALDKASYYIENETERDKIIQNSRNKIIAEHTYLHRVKIMCACIEDYWS